MSISVRCKCGKQLKVRDELAGKKVKCPACGGALLVQMEKEPEDTDEDIQAEERRRKKKKKTKQRRGMSKGMLIGLFGGGGAVMLGLVIWLVFLRGGGDGELKGGPPPKEEVRKVSWEELVALKEKHERGRDIKNCATLAVIEICPQWEQNVFDLEKDLKALGQGATNMLEEKLASPDAAVRHDAASMLLLAPGGLEVLGKALRHASPDAKYAAALRLTRVGDVPYIFRMNESDPGFRAAVKLAPVAFHGGDPRSVWPPEVSRGDLVRALIDGAKDTERVTLVNWVHIGRKAPVVQLEKVQRFEAYFLWPIPEGAGQIVGRNPLEVIDVKKLPTKVQREALGTLGAFTQAPEFKEALPVITELASSKDSGLASTASAILKGLKK